MATQTLTYWDGLTADGHSYQMGEQKHRLRILDELVKLKVHSLLDVGCGTGPIYDLLLKREDDRWDTICHYKGVDYSQGMIAVCKKEFPKGHFQVQDARSLLEPDESWDCVLLMHCLDHVDDYQSTIREATRVAQRYVAIILWRAFTGNQNRLLERNTFGVQPGQEPWIDTWMQEYSEQLLLDEFAKNNLCIVKEISGPEINNNNTNNYIYILEKYDES